MGTKMEVGLYFKCMWPENRKGEKLSCGILLKLFIFSKYFVFESF